MATFIVKENDQGIAEMKSTFNYANVDAMVQDLKRLVYNNTNFAYVMMQGLASMKVQMAENIFNFSPSNVPEPEHIESGVILQGPNIFVQTADGKTIEFWKYESAEETEENRVRNLINDYAYGVTCIRSERDFEKFKEFLDVAEEHFWECYYEPSVFESFDEPFAVFCNVQTETDFDGFDNKNLDVNVVFLSELTLKPVNLSIE